MKKNRKNFKISIALIASLLALVACSKSGEPSKNAEETHEFSGSYQFEENGCATGPHEYRSLEQYCIQLIDESLNKGCALQTRLTEFQLRCPVEPNPKPSQTPSSGSNPPPSPKPAPSPGPIAHPSPIPSPKPANPAKPSPETDCFNANTLPKPELEISLQSLVDGMNGYYRLVTVDSMVRTEDGDSKASLRVMTSVDTENNLREPPMKTVLACKKFSNTSGGEVRGNTNVPITIRRESGILRTSIDVSYKLFHPSLRMNDSLENSISQNSRAPSIQALAALSQQAESEMHVFQLTPTTFQIVILGKHSDKTKTIQTLDSFVYLFQPVTIAPIPAPESPKKNPTDSNATSGTGTNLPSSSIAKICMEYSYIGDRVECMKEFTGKSIQEIFVPICDQYSYLGDKVECLKEFIDRTVNDDVIKLCSDYSYLGDKVSCLKSFAR